jgi:hypothetical protein
LSPTFFSGIFSALDFFRIFFSPIFFWIFLAQDFFPDLSGEADPVSLFSSPVHPSVAPGLAG